MNYWCCAIFKVVWLCGSPRKYTSRKALVAPQLNIYVSPQRLNILNGRVYKLALELSTCVGFRLLTQNWAHGFTFHNWWEEEPCGRGTFLFAIKGVIVFKIVKNFSPNHFSRSWFLLRSGLWWIIWRQRNDLMFNVIQWPSEKTHQVVWNSLLDYGRFE